MAGSRTGNGPFSRGPPMTCLSVWSRSGRFQLGRAATPHLDGAWLPKQLQNVDIQGSRQVRGQLQTHVVTTGLDALEVLQRHTNQLRQLRLGEVLLGAQLRDPSADGPKHAGDGQRHSPDVAANGLPQKLPMRYHSGGATVEGVRRK